jgi:hypothetical protein
VNSKREGLAGAATTPDGETDKAKSERHEGVGGGLRNGRELEIITRIGFDEGEGHLNVAGAEIAEIQEQVFSESEIALDALEIGEKQ